MSKDGNTLFPFGLQENVREYFLFCCLTFSLYYAKRLLPSNASSAHYLLAVIPVLTVALSAALFPILLKDLASRSQQRIDPWDVLILIRLVAVVLLLRPWILEAHYTNWSLRFQSLSIALVLMTTYREGVHWTEQWSNMIHSLIPADLSFFAVMLSVDLLQEKFRVIESEKVKRFLGAIFVSYAFLSMGMINLDFKDILYVGNCTLLLVAALLLMAKEVRLARWPVTIFERLLELTSVSLILWNLLVYRVLEELANMQTLILLSYWIVGASCFL